MDMALSDKDGHWTVEYKDSLTQPHVDCREQAANILIVLSVALKAHHLRMPKDRANAKFHPQGQGLCGKFVCQWTESKVRDILG